MIWQKQNYNKFIFYFYVLFFSCITVSHEHISLPYLMHLLTAAVWFVKYGLEQRFTKLSKTHHYSIHAYHDALHTLASQSSQSNTPCQPCCDDCLKVFSGNSKPVPCIVCDATVRSSCFRSHKCSSNIMASQLPALSHIPRPLLKRGAADITAFEDSDDDPEMEITVT